MGVPRFSFIVPTYGRPEFLSEALESIRGQTIPDWECIVVDDASPAPTALPDDDRFTLIRRELNGGPAAARNTGVEAARGEIIVFLDDDDVLVPERLEIADKGLSEAPVALCWGGTLGRPDRVRNQSWNGDVLRTILCSTTPHLGQTAVIRQVMQPFDERYIGAQDVEWWLRLASRSRVATVPFVGWLWRKHEGDRGVNSMRARLEGRKLLLDTYSDYFAANPAAKAFQLKRLGLQLAQLGERREAARLLARSITLQPSITTIGNLLRLAVAPP